MTTIPLPTENLGPAADFVRPDFHQVNLNIENYLKQERNFKLDSGMLFLAVAIYFCFSN